MEVVFRIIISLAVMSKAIAINFENIVKSLPADVPDDLKNMLLKMHSDHPEQFTMPAMDGVTLIDFKTEVTQASTSFKTTVAKQFNSTKKIISNSTTKQPKTTTPLKRFLTAMRRPATTPLSLLRTATLRTGTLTTFNCDTTVAPPRTSTMSPDSSNIQSPRIAIAIPAPMPFYARVPIMMPMRTYFEPVIHDHPPLYKIREMIEEDERRWRLEKHGKDCDISVEIGTDLDSDRSKDSDSDTDTDDSSDYMNPGSDYYDSLIRIHRRRDDEDRK